MQKLIQKNVSDAEKLKDKYTDERNIPVYYACIFCQSDEEHDFFIAEARKVGKAVEERPNSLLFKISPIETIAGELELLRIRQPDASKHERGDADFVVRNYEKFKEKYLKEPGFILIPRGDSEMIELSKAGEDVRVYFSAPALVSRLQSL